VLSADIGAESCLLCQTDSSTATGWLGKSNFADKLDEAVQLTTACQLTNLLIETKSCLYSQWFPGEFNTISDPLSRDFHLPSTTLSTLFVTHVSEQAPFGLIIQSLPEEIDSWLTLLLCNQPQKELWLKAPMPSKFMLALGILNISNLTQSEPPWTAWHRPKSWQTGQASGLMSMESLHSFYSASCVDTPPLTNLNPSSSYLRKFYQMSLSLADKALFKLFIGAFFL
jgi:hypothetical protein